MSCLCRIFASGLECGSSPGLVPALFKTSFVLVVMGFPEASAVCYHVRMSPFPLITCLIFTSAAAVEAASSQLVAFGNVCSFVDCAEVGGDSVSGSPASFACTLTGCILPPFIPRVCCFSGRTVGSCTAWGDRLCSVPCSGPAEPLE